MPNKKITYFDTTKKLLQNLENCTSKDIDSEFIKEALKTLINIIQSQNQFIEYLVELDDNMELISDDRQIIKGMICYIRGRKRFGKIIEIDKEENIYTLLILGTEETLRVTKKAFNI
tara:strand:- start:4068 stop:4418 length:351 start_codon:yes stop_codon:yes gene_type:complete